MKKRNFYLAIILIGGLVFGLYYFGIVQKIQINEQEIGPFKVAYETHLGDYSEVGAVQEKIFQSLVSDGINTTRGFGIYYDNPDEVKKEDLRSEVGVIIDEKDYSKVNVLRGRYNIKDIARSKSIVATFPYRNKFSIMLGIFRVYPKLNEYIEDKGYAESPVMEIYDLKNQKIYYIIEI